MGQQKLAYQITCSLTVPGKLFAQDHDHKHIRIRSLKNQTKERYIQTLKEINFPGYTNFNSADVAYDDFKAKLPDVIDKVAPIKEVRIKSNTQEWFDDESIMLSKTETNVSQFLKDQDFMKINQLLKRHKTMY